MQRYISNDKKNEALFEAAVENDKALEKLQNLKELSFTEQEEQITALAAEVGITLTEDDFKQVDGAELTDDELEKTAGGIRSMDDMIEEMMFLMLKNAEQNANMSRVFEEELGEAVSESAVGGNGS